MVAPNIVFSKQKFSAVSESWTNNTVEFSQIAMVKNVSTWFDNKLKTSV